MPPVSTNPSSPHALQMGKNLKPEKMPGHWLLASAGKRVLRPGGLQLTHHMLDALAIGPSDHVIEFAPGLGITTRMTLSKKPASYTAIERDAAAAKTVQKLLTQPQYQCQIGTAEETGLPDQSATVVYGEAMLSMQTLEQKRRIIKEAYRLLAPGGRFALHELAINTTDPTEREELEKALTQSIHVGVRPLPLSEWTALLQSEGFEVELVKKAPMHLLEPRRVIQDEGLLRTLFIIFNVLRKPNVRQRVFHMRSVFKRYRQQLMAVTIVCTKSNR